MFRQAFAIAATVFAPAVIIGGAIAADAAKAPNPYQGPLPAYAATCFELTDAEQQRRQLIAENAPLIDLEVNSVYFLETAADCRKAGK